LNWFLLGHYFDMHQRPILYLIHKVQLSTIGQKMGRNELRLKYHYHTCPFRLKPDFFLQIYDLLYSRILGFNRYTLILGKNFCNQYLNFIFLKKFLSFWYYNSIYYNNT
jgi:hypothetical protein